MLQGSDVTADDDDSRQDLLLEEGEIEGEEGRESRPTDWSEDGGASTTCGTERCLRERRHLHRVVEELRLKLQAAEEEAQKKHSEILDLRQQVSMLSGFGLSNADGQPQQYVGSYDVVSKDACAAAATAAAAAASSSLVRSGPFAGHRIKHQRINPALIIKEKDIII